MSEETQRIKYTAGEETQIEFNQSGGVSTIAGIRMYLSLDFTELHDYLQFDIEASGNEAYPMFLCDNLYVYNGDLYLGIPDFGHPMYPNTGEKLASLMQPTRFVREYIIETTRTPGIQGAQQVWYVRLQLSDPYTGAVIIDRIISGTLAPNYLPDIHNILFYGQSGVQASISESYRNHNSRICIKNLLVANRYRNPKVCGQDVTTKIFNTLGSLDRSFSSLNGSMQGVAYYESTPGLGGGIIQPSPEEVYEDRFEIVTKDEADLAFEEAYEAYEESKANIPSYEPPAGQYYGLKTGIFEYPQAHFPRYAYISWRVNYTVTSVLAGLKFKFRILKESNPTYSSDIRDNQIAPFLYVNNGNLAIGRVASGSVITETMIPISDVQELALTYQLRRVENWDGSIFHEVTITKADGSEMFLLAFIQISSLSFLGQGFNLGGDVLNRIIFSNVEYTTGAGGSDVFTLNSRCASFSGSSTIKVVTTPGGSSRPIESITPEEIFEIFQPVTEDLEPVPEPPPPPPPPVTYVKTKSYELAMRVLDMANTKLPQLLHNEADAAFNLTPGLVLLGDISISPDRMTVITAVKLFGITTSQRGEERAKVRVYSPDLYGKTSPVEFIYEPYSDSYVGYAIGRQLKVEIEGSYLYLTQAELEVATGGIL